MKREGSGGKTTVHSMQCLRRFREELTRVCIACGHSVPEGARQRAEKAGEEQTEGNMDTAVSAFQVD